ncbi:unnamed protein product [Heligmosomoides polygyrus]|uniref:Reverse transcriptase domain-containing protein n=1 Tax=Heligmosomoides polygyrus TaxID=6339 RepID=A0A3P8DWW0_HELPZ|nr:unnamed protein product [Heligmosomoides polygyrus]
MDSGASISYMKASIARKFQTQAQTANGTAVTLLDAMILLIQIGEYPLLHLLHVSDDNECPALMLLGTDFIRTFHKIPLERDHYERTAFACFLGAFEYIRMPMGLKCALATIQRIMDNFKKNLRAQVFIYIDDLIITSRCQTITSPTSTKCLEKLKPT